MRDLPRGVDGLGIPEVEPDGPPAAKVERVLRILAGGRVEHCAECGQRFYLVTLPTTKTQAPITPALDWHSDVHPRCTLVGGHTTIWVDTETGEPLTSRPPT